MKNGLTIQWRENSFPVITNEPGDKISYQKDDAIKISGSE